MLQQKLGDGKGGHLWVSPARDIAHAFPQYIARAAHLATEDIGRAPGRAENMARLKEHLGKINAFVDAAVGANRGKTLEEAVGASGLVLDNPSNDAVNLFNKWMVRIVFGAFYRGVVDATHGGQETPYGWEDLKRALDEVSRVEKKRTVWQAIGQCMRLR